MVLVPQEVYVTMKHDGHLCHGISEQDRKIYNILEIVKLPDDKKLNFITMRYRSDRFKDQTRRRKTATTEEF